LLQSRREIVTRQFTLPLYGRGVDECECVLERLGRIEALDRAGADRDELLAELRALVDEAESWSRKEGGDAGERAVDGLRSALDRDMIAA
jgi:hypothetical protein